MRACAYRRAMVASLDEMLVQPYEERLLHLEQKILDGSIEPNANAIEDFLGEFSISLVGTTEALKKIIEDDADEEDDTSEDGFYGAKLLDELSFRYRQCGSFETKNALRMARRFAMRAFYGHCFVWLAFGTVAEERCYGGEGIEKRKEK